jgi:hypothetical protein
MSESIAEMVIPGTYIDVRAEGLISVGSIATGNIGVVGTAARGPIGEIVALGSYSDAITTFGTYDAFASPNVSGHPLTLTRTIEKLYQGGAGSVFAVRIANATGGAPVAASVDVHATGNAAGFTLTAARFDPDSQTMVADPGTWGNSITYTVVNKGTQGQPKWTLTLAAGTVKETYTGTNMSQVHDAIVAGSRLVTVTVDQNANLATDFAQVGTPTPLQNGTDGANVASPDVETGLGVLDDPTTTINIVVVAGLGVDVVADAVGAHVEATENEGRERIAIIGASASDSNAVGNDATTVANKRIVLVAPGIVDVDRATGKAVTLPPSYLAAVVAGRLSALAPEISLTNQGLPVTVDVHYNSAQLKTLLLDRVLLVRLKAGSQVVKGITTDNGAFKQISVRRVVDYAKAGVRLGADPYIGLLNNARVRAALKATLDAFLSQMVLDEMLTAYELDVTATRAQEIAGIAMVTMTLQPTFSIDFIQVTMTLQ